MPIERPQIKVDVEGAKKRLDQAIRIMNERMEDGGRGLAFKLDSSLNRPVVTVTNQETGEVIRQIPNEVVIRMARSIDQTKGNLLNAKVWFVSLIFCSLYQFEFNLKLVAQEA